MMEIDKLIHGKNPLDKIVSIEIENDQAIVFRELDNNIEKQILSHKFWILATRPFGEGWVRLNGELDYKWGKQYSKLHDYLNDKKKLPYTEIFTVSNPIEACMIKDGLCFFKGLKHNEVSILSFDIETTGLEHNDESKILLISNTFRKKDHIIKRLFSYEDYENCAEMVADWCEWVRTIDPSLIIGHNILSYDLPYIEFCASKYGGTVQLGRNNSDMVINRSYEAKFRVDGSRDLHYYKVKIYGRQVIDTMFLAYKYDFQRKYESYGLKKIIAYEGLEKKDRTFYDAGQIRHQFLNPIEWKKIKEYCKDDADDSLALYDLMGPSIFYFTQAIPKPFQLMTESATGSQLNALLIRAYLQDKHSLPKASPAEEFPGAYSFGIPGIYRNVAKIDIKSEYPSCILQYEIWNREKDPNGYFYKMVEFFTNERFRNKKLAKETGLSYYTDMEQAQKIGINSAYGLLGAPGLLFNSPKDAALVTEMGRKTIETATIWASSKPVEYWLEKIKDG